MNTEDIARICGRIFPYHELHKLGDEYYLNPKSFGTVNQISFNQKRNGWIFRFHIGEDILRYDSLGIRRAWYLENSNIEVDLVSATGERIELLAANLQEFAIT